MGPGYEKKSTKRKKESVEGWLVICSRLVIRSRVSAFGKGWRNPGSKGRERTGCGWVPVGLSQRAMTCQGPPHISLRHPRFRTI
jgi:hypothetical protein